MTNREEDNTVRPAYPVPYATLHKRELMREFKRHLQYIKR